MKHSPYYCYCWLFPIRVAAGLHYLRATADLLIPDRSIQPLYDLVLRNHYPRVYFEDWPDSIMDMLYLSAEEYLRLHKHYA